MKYDLEGICQDCMYLEKIKPLFEQLQQENQQLKDENTQLRIEISAMEEDYRKLEKIVKDVGLWNTLYNEEFNKNKKLEEQKERFMKSIIGTKFYSGIEILEIIEELGWDK